MVLIKFDADWAKFTQAMLDAASMGYEDPTFVNTISLPGNRIGPMAKTDLIIHASFAPVYRLRNNEVRNNEEATTAVYLGNEPTDPTVQGNVYSDNKLFTTVLLAACVVTDVVAGFVYGSQDRTSYLKTYTGTVPAKYEWKTWEPFFFYPYNNKGETIVGIKVNI